jgi:hypothetical protein
VHPQSFYRHLARNAGFAAILVACSLSAGAAGYHYSEGLPWLDALLNAAMILTGMGPVDKVQSPAGKLFATCYALFSGIVFLSTAALVLMPVAHRVLHAFHLQVEGDKERGSHK